MQHAEMNGGEQRDRATPWLNVPAVCVCVCVCVVELSDSGNLLHHHPAGVRHSGLRLVHELSRRHLAVPALRVSYGHVSALV